MEKVRNEKLDVIRGIAAFLVIAGHAMQVYDGYSDNPLFNFITSIQMPLFMMVSGYAIGFSAPIGGGISFYKFVKKRTLSLMLPWLVWSVLAYLILSNVTVWEYIKFAAYHMESAFWFLFSLWCIHMVFAIASLISSRIRVGEMGRIVIILLLCMVMNALLLLCGRRLGMTFLGIKYTTYYMMFYLIGWLLQKFDLRHSDWTNTKIASCCFITITVFFAVMLSKISIVSMPDSPVCIIIRFVVSLCGCFSVFFFVQHYTIKNNIVRKIVGNFSIFSLELYVVQCILLRRFVSCEGINVTSSLGMINYCFYLILFSIICFAIIKVLSISPITRLFFFGKPLKNK